MPIINYNKIIAHNTTALILSCLYLEAINLKNLHNQTQSVK